MSAGRDLKRLFIALVVLVAGTAGLGTLLYVAADNVLGRGSAEGSCWRVSSYDCWNLSPGFISHATGIDLPDGTDVTASSTHAWLSWNLSATVVYPKGAALPSETAQQSPIIRPVGSVNGRPVFAIYLVEHGGATWPTPR